MSVEMGKCSSPELVRVVCVCVCARNFKAVAVFLFEEYAENLIKVTNFFLRKSS